MLERTQLDGMSGELCLDRGAPGVDLAAPVILGVGSAQVVATQASFEIDALAPKSREPGSDLAIGHNAIVLVGIPPTRPGGTNGGYWSCKTNEETDR